MLLASCNDRKMQSSWGWKAVLIKSCHSQIQIHCHTTCILKTIWTVKWLNMGTVFTTQRFLTARKRGGGPPQLWPRRSLGLYKERWHLGSVRVFTAAPASEATSTDHPGRGRRGQVCVWWQHFLVFYNLANIWKLQAVPSDIATVWRRQMEI